MKFCFQNNEPFEVEIPEGYMIVINGPIDFKGDLVLLPECLNRSGKSVFINITETEYNPKYVDGYHLVIRRIK